MSIKRIHIGVTLAFTLFTIPIHAETWQLGILAENSRSPFINGQSETNALPMVNYIGERFSYVAGKAQFVLSTGKGSETYLVGQIRQRQFYSASFDFDDDLEIEGMNGRHSAFEMGLGSTKQSTWGKYEFEGLIDVTGAHEGFELTVKYSYPKLSGRWLIEPAISLQLQGKNLVDYYHGISDSEAHDERPAYEGTQAINSLLSMTVGYSINPQLFAIAGMEQLDLDNSISDSPIIDEQQIRKIYLGLIYTF